MRQDVIDFEILDDGTIKWTTGKVSQANHSSADMFLREVGRLLGGTTTVERRAGHEHAAHTHSHEHAQDA